MALTGTAMLATTLATALAGVLAAAPAQASDVSELVQRINSYRAAPAQCEGRASPALPPLQPSAALASVRLAPGDFLQQDLARAGYRSLRAEAVGVSGAHAPADAMALLQARHCATLRAPDARDIGVVQTSDGWSVIVARENILAPLPSQEAATAAILAATNRARATARTCGTQYFAAAPPLMPNAALDRAAFAHSSDMAALRYFSHEGKDGSTVGDRASRAGYAWRGIGENIASGMRTPEEAVAGWIASPGHCANLMNAGFTDMGAGFAQSSDPATGIVFWTQEFGRPR
jgi:uncharacterized protein YkwD